MQEGDRTRTGSDARSAPSNPPSVKTPSVQNGKSGGWASLALLLTAVTVIAGLTPIAVRMATAELPPLTIAFCRFGTAGLLLFVTARVLGLQRPIDSTQRRLLIALGFLCVPVNQIGYLFGIKLANASHAGIAYALVPVLVFWISLTLRRTTFTVRVGLASSLAFIGAAVVDVFTAPTRPSGSPLDLRMLLGDGLLLSASLSWSLFVVLSQPLVKELGAVQTLVAVFLYGTLWQVPLVLVDALWFDLSTFQPSHVTWRGFAGFGYITFVTAYTNYLLWYLVTARYDVTRSSVVTNAHFVITVLLEAAFFDLFLNAWVALGSAILLAGIALATVKKRETSPAD